MINNCDHSKSVRQLVLDVFLAMSSRDGDLEMVESDDDISIFITQTAKEIENKKFK